MTPLIYAGLQSDVRKSYISSIQQPEVEKIMSVVANYYGVSVGQIVGKSRVFRIATARHMVAYILKKRGLTYVAIGGILNRDHSTIISSVDKVEFEKDKSPMVNRAYSSISKHINKINQ